MKRRVTVHFGDVRVVVPCLHEDTTVADLAEAAIIRYKKATGKVHRSVVTAWHGRRRILIGTRLSATIRALAPPCVSIIREPLPASADRDRV
ncbi:hypothetical protein OSTOST_15069, partial [Ostertagia ostertagi]